MQPETRDLLMKNVRPVAYAAAAALAVLALFLLVKTFDAMALFGDGQNPPFNTITVSGEGESAAVPDIATISFTVQETAATVAAAQEAATKKTDAAIEAVGALEIADEDVKTTSYQVYPQYESQACFNGRCPQSSPKITGYQISQSIEVKVRDTAKVSEVLAQLGTIGVQNVSGPNFMVDDDSDIAQEARDNAIADAREQAERLANQLGVKLGDVVSYYEDTGAMPYDAYGYGGAMDMKAASVAPQSMPNLPMGEQERKVTVQVTYRIH